MIINEFESLDYFYKRLSDKMKESVPVPLFYGNIGGIAFFIESSLKGELCSQKITLRNGYFERKIIQRNIKNVQKWLIQFQQETQKGEIQIDRDFIEKNILPQVNLFKSRYVLDKKETGFLEEFLTRFRHHMKATIPVGGIHGDFYIENTFFQKGKVSVFDWSFASREGIPFVDLFMFASSFYVDSSEDSLDSFEKIFFSKHWFSLAIKQFLLEYFIQRGLNLRLLHIFFSLFLIQMAIRNPLKYGIHTCNNDMWKKKFDFYVENHDSFLI